MRIRPLSGLWGALGSHLGAEHGSLLPVGSWKQTRGSKREARWTTPEAVRAIDHLHAPVLNELAIVVVQRGPDQDTRYLAFCRVVMQSSLQRLGHHLVRQRGRISKLR